MSREAKREPLRAGYQRRKPELTPLNQLVADHINAFREHVREQYERGLPRYVEEELDG